MSINRSRLLLLFVISLGSFMGALDNTIVNVSLPVIADYYHVGTGEVALVVVAYMLVSTSMVLLFGYLGQRVGYRKIFVVGFLAFVLSSMMCGLSGGIWELIGWRAFQGLGSAMFGAVLAAMIFSFFPEEERTKALAIMVSMSSLASVIGPVLGGMLTSYLSWHWVFFVNVPIGIIGAVIGLKTIPKVVPKTAGKFDTFGAVFVMAAMFLTVYYLNIGKEWGWVSTASLTILAGAVLSWVFLVFWERRNANPALNIKMFKDRGFALGNLAGFLMMAVLLGTTFILPFYYEMVKGLSVGDTGLILLLPAVFSVIFGLKGAKWCERFGERKVAMVSAGIGTVLNVGFFLLAGWYQSPLWLWVVVSCASGASVGLFIPPCTKLVMARCSEENVGDGASINTTMKSIGMTSGVAIFEAILSAFSPVPTAHVMLGATVMETQLEGFELAFLLSSFMTLISFLAIIFYQGRATKSPVCAEAGSGH